MNLVVIYSLIGMVAGAVILGYGGWLLGGLVGFLLGQVSQLSGRLKTLEQKFSLLQQKSAEVAASPREADSSSTAPSQPPPDVAPPSAPSANIPQARPPGPLSHSATELRASAREQHLSEAKPKVAASVSTAANPAAAGDGKPAGPDPINKLFTAVRRFLTEGNPIVRVGMVVMFFGLSFLVKYASSEGMFPIELRLAAIAAVAIALIVLGWLTRGKKNGYGLVLQGGGIAALYLTVFAASKVYPLLPSGFAFALMFAIVMLGAALAVLQNAQVLALMATAGGFLAPILTSDGSGNHVGLFSFYLLLNLGVLAIAWFKAWRMLNWVGFVFTFVITSAWGVLSYEPQLYASTQPFLLAYFALYLTVSVLFSLKQPPILTGLVDGSLVFGLPIVGFGLQAALLKHTEYGLALSAVLLSGIYIALARMLWGRYQQTHRLLIESFIALGVAFATLAIPLALDADWTSATWALEASGLIWVGLRQQRLLPRVAGYLLYMAAAVSLLIKGGLYAGPIPILSGDFIGLFILAAAAFCIAYLLKTYADNITSTEGKVEWIAIWLGVAYWLLAGINDLLEHVPAYHHFAVVVLFVSLSTLASMRIGGRLHWQKLIRSGFCLLPLIALWTAFSATGGLFSSGDLHPSRGFGLLAVATFMLVQYRLLWVQRERHGQTLLNAYHALSAWLLVLLVFWEAGWWQDTNNWFGTAALILWFVCFTSPLVLLMGLLKKGLWPFNQYEAVYKHLIPVPLMALLLLWFIEACASPGTTGQFYLPVLNPLDLAQFAAVLVTAYAIKYNMLRSDLAGPQLRQGILGLAGFVWLNLIVLRAVHHYAGVNYTYAALWNAVELQMALSILWTLCALLVMSLSRRRQERKLWVVGAALLGLVVLKLFTKDLTGSGTLARIVSFMVVGGLMLTIGYLSPMPSSSSKNTRPSPKPTEETAQ